MPLIKSALLDAVIQKRIDVVDDNTTYVGFADVGILNSDARWQIQKFDATGGDLSVQYANAGAFDQVWDNRNLLTYL